MSRAVAWLVVSRGGMQVVSFLATLVVVRLLHPSDYGLVAIAGTLTNTVMWLSQLGLGAAIVQYPDVDDAEVNACFWLSLGLAVAGYAGLYLVAPAAERWFAIERLAIVIRVLGVALVVAVVQTVPLSLLRKRLSLDRVAQAEIGAAAVTIPTMLALAQLGAGVWTLVSGILITQIVQGVLAFRFARFRPGFSVRGRRTGQIVRFGFTTLAGQVCWMTYVQADTFILGKVAGGTALGFYAMARQLATVISEKVSLIVNQIASPVMAGQQADPAAIRRSLLRGVRYVAWSTLPIGAGLCLVGRDFVRVVLTDTWLPALPLLDVLCVQAVLHALAVLLPPVLSARYRVRYLLGYHFALMLLLPVAFWLGATWAGAMGVAVAWATIYPLVVGRLAREALREVGGTWRDLAGELTAPVTATAVMVAAVALFQAAARSWGAPEGLWPLAGAVAVGVVAYAAGVALLGGHVVAEARGVLDSLAGRGAAARRSA